MLNSILGAFETVVLFAGLWLAYRFVVFIVRQELHIKNLEAKLLREYMEDGTLTEQQAHVFIGKQSLFSRFFIPD
jgi:hypothetical protein